VVQDLSPLEFEFCVVLRVFNLGDLVGGFLHYFFEDFIDSVFITGLLDVAHQLNPLIRQRRGPFIGILSTDNHLQGFGLVGWNLGAGSKRLIRLEDRVHHQLKYSEVLGKSNEADLHPRPEQLQLR